MSDYKSAYLALYDSVTDLRTQLEGVLMQMEAIYTRCEELAVLELVNEEATEKEAAG